MLCSIATGRAHAQDLGHRLAGSLGLDAGTVGPPGLYFADRLVYYGANQLMDRHGDPAAAGLDLYALGNAVGLAGIIAIPATPVRLSAAIAFPTVWAGVSADRPSIHSHTYGLSDVMFRPLQLGLKFERVSALAEYALYIPSARFVLDSGHVSQGQFTHQFTLGGSVNFDAKKRWFAGAVISYNLNQRKIGIDIERGDTVQVQGGAGMRPSQRWELGIAGYGLWQVQHDQGEAIPVTLRGASERAYAAGPDVALRIPAISAVIRLRFELEFLVTSRPSGRVVVLGIAFGPMKAGAEGSGAIGQ